MYHKLHQLAQYLPKIIRKIIALPIGFFMDLQKNRTMLKTYKEFVNNGDLVYDIGSNKGDMTELFLKLGAEVVTVEPQKEMIEVLKKRFGDYKTVHIIPKGISNKKGKLKLYVCSENSSIASFNKNWHEYEELNKESYEVEVITLDDLIEIFGIPKFCKIDVEGHEFEVIKGLTKKIKSLSFEFTAESFNQTKKCIEELKRFDTPKFKFTFFPNYKLGKKWLDADDIIDVLSKRLTKKYMFGDIFVVFER